MATSSHPPAHAGLDRVVERVNVTHDTISGLFSVSKLPTLVLGLSIMAVVTLTERAMDGLDTGFALEWAVLTVVALVTFALFGRTVRRRTRAVLAWCTDFAVHAEQTRADVKGLLAGSL